MTIENTCTHAPYANDLGVTTCAICGNKCPEEKPKNNRSLINTLKRHKSKWDSVEYCRGIDDAIAIIRQHVAAPDVSSGISVISDLPKRLRIVSDMINMGDKISWGEETALMDQAADEIDRLSKPVSVADVQHRLFELEETFSHGQIKTALTAAGVTCHE